MARELAQRSDHPPPDHTGDPTVFRPFPMAQPPSDHPRIASDRRRPVPATDRAIITAALTLLLLAVPSEPLLTVLGLQAGILLAAWRLA